jgi:hypothetical protein
VVALGFALGWGVVRAMTSTKTARAPVATWAPGGGDLRPTPPATARSAFGKAVAGLVSAGAATPKLELPPLDDLSRTALDDPRAASLRTGLLGELGRRLFAAPGCLSPGHPGFTVVSVPMTVSVASESQASVAASGPPTVVEGAPLDPPAIDCVEARLAGPMTLRASGSRTFPPGFEGEVHLSFRLSPR